MTLRRFLHLSVLLLVLLGAPLFASEIASSTQERADWIADGNQLVDSLLSLHPDPDWRAGQETIDASLARAQRALASATHDEGRFVALLRMVAALRDGHTIVSPRSRHARLGWTAVETEAFAEGVFIVGIAAEHAELLGSRVVAVHSLPIDQALEALRPLVPHSIESRFLRWFPSYLKTPGIWTGLGTGAPADRLVLDLRTLDGKKHQVSLPALFGEAADLAYAEMVRITDRLRQRATPPLRYASDKPYDLTKLKESKTVFVSYRRVTSSEEEPFWQFDTRLFKAIDELGAERLILDMRDNGGGGYQNGAFLLAGIRARPRLLLPGGLIVLTSRTTFSAAIDVLNELILEAGAIVIGEPPGAEPNSPGDDDPITLEHSGIEVLISRVYSQATFQGDDRKAIRPDLEIDERFTDRLAGRDRALNAALGFRPEAIPRTEGEDRTLGRWAFSPGRDLRVRQISGQVRGSIPGRLDATLVPLGGGRFALPFEGGYLVLPAGPALAARWVSSTGQVNELAPLDPHTLSVWEQLRAGNFEAAEPRLRELHAAGLGEQASLGDGGASFEAIRLYYALKGPLGRDAARRVTARFLRLAIELADGEAPMSTYALDFYE